MNELRDQLEQAIAALEAQRAVLGDAVVMQALGPLREKLSRLDGAHDDQQLRQVTVLFTDIVGSTSLSQHLDPEDINLVIDGALQRLTAIVEAHAGKVLQYAGDNLLAVFGGDTAREDDPARAVSAGLEIVEAGRALHALVLQRHGHDGCNLRVGIHTGGVLLGGGVDGDHSVRGMAVNIAAHMEQTAPVGGLRISHETHRHVRGLFEVQEQPPLWVKGREEALVTYLVAGAGRRPHRQALRGVDGVQAPLIGRENEFDQLRRAWCRLRTSEGVAQSALTVVAEAGLGKSRLVTEFHRWVDQQKQPYRWLESHASEAGMHQAHGGLRELFTGQLQILDSDAPEVARAKWSEAMTPMLAGAADAAVLGHLLGFDYSDAPEVRALLGEGRRLRDRAFFHATQLLRRMAGDAAVLLVFDDLHWADDGTLDFIDHLLTHHGDLALLVIGLTRPPLFERRPGWGSGWPSGGRVDLPALGVEQAERLADALLRKLPEVPVLLRELVTRGADGNPYFIEELVNMLIDHGAILTRPGTWQLVPTRLNALDVPSTLTGLLQARLDALPADEWRTLQRAAVIGPVFWDDALVALRVPLLDTLQSLIRRELVVERQVSGLEGKREFGFRHHTLHQVTYERVLKRVKRPAHARVARWLASQPGQPQLDQIAEHFERGGEPDRALDYWQRAAEAAQAHFASVPALSHGERALALVPPDALARRWDLNYLRVQALTYLSEPERLAVAMDELELLAERLADSAHRARTLERRARYHYDRGDAGEALTCARQAAALAEGIDEQCAVLSQMQVLIALGRLGRYGEARDVASSALARARAAGMPRTEAAILNEIGNYAVDEGDLGAAIDHLDEALALHREAGDRANESGTRSNLAFVAMTLGDYATAQRQFMEALALSAAIGQRADEGISRVNLALVLLNQGQAAASLGQAQQALGLLRATRDRWGEAAALRVAGQASQALGDSAAATGMLTASRELFDELELPHLAMEAIAALAATLLARGDLDGALAQVDEVLNRQLAGARLEGTDEPMRIRWLCWQVLDSLGDKRAAKALVTAWQELSARAEQIGDPAHRQAFLEAVPFHRAIVAAWEARQAADADDRAGGAPG